MPRPMCQSLLTRDWLIGLSDVELYGRIRAQAARHPLLRPLVLPPRPLSLPHRLSPPSPRPTPYNTLPHGENSFEVVPTLGFTVAPPGGYDTTAPKYQTSFDATVKFQTSYDSAATSTLMDVDDINDGDLLSADIANMNVILNDLNTPGRPVPIPAPGPAPRRRTNLAELFADCPGVAPAAVDSGVPELTTVNMFWNDLPGLMLNGREHVRLVDIHKQIMPAKVCCKLKILLSVEIFANMV